jgi:small-conductance mechanosensitive channel/CRP-like cAMP-binding protein
MPATEPNTGLPLRLALSAVVFAAALGLSAGSGVLAEFWRSATGQEDTFWLVALLQTVACFAGTHFLLRLVAHLFWDGLIARSTGYRVPAIIKTLTAVVAYLLTATFVVGVVLQQSVTAFLTAIGAGSVVLGLAVRGIFEDLFTGLAVNIDRNVQIGDWLALPDRVARTTVGRVVEIGWRCTQLETEEGTMLIIPNGLLGREVITNLTRPSAATRYECVVHLDGDLPSDRGRRITLGALRSLLGTRGFVPDREPAIIVREATDRGIEYVLRYWILPWNPLSPSSARDAVMSRVLQHLASAGLAPSISREEVFFSRAADRVRDEDAAAERVGLLRRVALFSELDDDDYPQLAESMERLVLPAHETVFLRGDSGDTLYVVAEGSLDVLVPSGDRDAHRIATLGPGDFFGEMSLLTGEPRKATIRTATSAVLYELPRHAVARLSDARPQVAEMLSRCVATRMVVLDAALAVKPETVKRAHIESMATQIARLMKDVFRARMA